MHVIQWQRRISMHSTDIYLGQETPESINKDIEACLMNGSKVETIAKSFLKTEKAKIIITKWEGAHISELSEAEQLEILIKYISELQSNIKSSCGSCVSQDIKKLMEANYYGIDVDEYSDYLTELINSDGYTRVNHNISNILACFKPYIDEHYPSKYELLTKQEKEVALVNFIKEHLSTCSN